jgi:hypothetical protein
MIVVLSRMSVTEDSELISLVELGSSTKLAAREGHQTLGYSRLNLSSKPTDVRLSDFVRASGRAGSKTILPVCKTASGIVRILKT